MNRRFFEKKMRSELDWKGRSVSKTVFFVDYHT